MVLGQELGSKVRQAGKGPPQGNPSPVGVHDVHQDAAGGGGVLADEAKRAWFNGLRSFDLVANDGVGIHGSKHAKGFARCERTLSTLYGTARANPAFVAEVWERFSNCGENCPNTIGFLAVTSQLERTCRFASQEKGG